MVKPVRTLTLAGALIVVTAVLVFTSQYLEERRIDAREGTCRGRLSQIALALRAYHSDYGVFPPLKIHDQSGTPIHSWRVLLLPYMELDEFYSRYDFAQPWNSPHNAAFSRSVPQYVRELFRCPNDLNSTSECTSFLAIERSLDTETRNQTVIPTRQSTNPCHIVLIELHESGIQWLEPKDLPLQQALNGVLQLSPTAGNANFLTADFQIGTLSPNSILFRNPEADLLKQWLSYHARQDDGD